jgi:hypothetical protein
LNLAADASMCGSLAPVETEPRDYFSPTCREGGDGLLNGNDEDGPFRTASPPPA